MERYLFNQYYLIFLLVVMFVLVSCSDNTTTPPEVIPSDTPVSTPTPTTTPTPFIPSPTPIPLAAKVNGEDITEAEFQAELARFERAQTEAALSVDESFETIVLDELINQLLLVQGARQADFIVGDALIDERWNRLVKDAGGEQAIMGWLAGNGYSVESFHQALARSIAVAWMRDQIAGAVSETAEQVHARQILLYNLEQAQEILAQLESGNDFATLAATFDPVISGDLGWFPRGYLDYEQLEQAVFDLQSLEYSGIVETPLGFHILQLIEREPDRMLNPDARLVLQNNAVRKWLEDQRNQSEIVILLPET
jgi:parvulin-like peptidyl-prolyl isomerase